MKKLRQIKEGRKIIALSSILICIILIVSIFWINAHAELTPIKTIEITSEKVPYRNTSDYTTHDGSWKITKSAKWVDYGKAEVTYTFEPRKLFKNDNRDIIVVMDTSAYGLGWISAEHFLQFKKDMKIFVDEEVNEGANIALIRNTKTYANYITEFTNDKNILHDKIDNLNTGGLGYADSSYAFEEIDKLLEKYDKPSNKDVIVIFIACNFSGADKGEYEGYAKYLKNKYPYVTLNGISYYTNGWVWDISGLNVDAYRPTTRLDFGFTVSDNYISYVGIVRELFLASGSLLFFDEINLDDYINNKYFYLEDDYNNNQNNGLLYGDLNVKKNNSDEILNWNVPKDVLKSGQTYSFSYIVTLKDEYLNKGGIYAISEKENIFTKIYGKPDEDIVSNKTPILADNFKVYYDTNAPADCDIDYNPEAEYTSVFKQVKINDKVLKCDGYQFKGWKIVEEGVTKLNDEYFIMPESNVTLRAEWSKLSINKNMDGEVKSAQSLYDIMRDNSVADNVESEFVKESSDGKTQIQYYKGSTNTNGKGIYMFSPTKDDTYPVYFYRGDIHNNNVAFANQCWKAVITTSTGGVKLIHNGSQNADGTCQEQAPNLIKNMPYNYHGDQTALGFYGYMFGRPYYHFSVSTLTERNMISLPENYGVVKGTENLDITVGGYSDPFMNVSRDNTLLVYNSKHYYASSYTYSNGVYTLVNPVEYTLKRDNVRIKNMYTCPVYGQTSCEKLYFINITSSSSGSTYEISDQASIDKLDETYTIGKSYKKNNDGTYTLLNTSIYSYKETLIGNNNIKQGDYICDNLTDTCSNLRMANNDGFTSYNYTDMNADEVLYGTDVTYSNGTYKLKNTAKFSEVIYNPNVSAHTHRYTCFNTSGECNNVYYAMMNYDSDFDKNLIQIFQYNSNYIQLTGEANIAEVVSNMHTNTSNSTVKSTLDSVYSLFNDYDEYIEDTIYCNDRRFTENSPLNVTSELPIYNSSGLGISFKSASRNYAYMTKYDDVFGRHNTIYADFTGPDLSCEKNDSFTVSSTLGNGKLNHPIGLLTLDEYILAGGQILSGYNSVYNYNFYLMNGENYYLMTPFMISDSSFMAVAQTSQNTSTAYMEPDYWSYFDSYQLGIRPVISIKHDVAVNGGDGTATNPYVFKLD